MFRIVLSLLHIDTRPQSRVKCYLESIASSDFRSAWSSIYKQHRYPKLLNSFDVQKTLENFDELIFSRNALLPESALWDDLIASENSKGSRRTIIKARLDKFRSQLIKIAGQRMWDMCPTQAARNCDFFYQAFTLLSEIMTYNLEILKVCTLDSIIACTIHAVYRSRGNVDTEPMVFSFKQLLKSYPKNDIRATIRFYNDTFLTMFKSKVIAIVNGVVPLIKSKVPVNRDTKILSYELEKDLRVFPGNVSVNEMLQLLFRRKDNIGEAQNKMEIEISEVNSYVIDSRGFVHDRNEKGDETINTQSH
ncbi:hypothetical protein ACOME3_009251 [Neoechinorhynchus agilis]